MHQKSIKVCCAPNYHRRPAGCSGMLAIFKDIFGSLNRGFSGFLKIILTKHFEYEHTDYPLLIQISAHTRPFFVVVVVAISPMFKHASAPLNLSPRTL